MMHGQQNVKFSTFLTDFPELVKISNLEKILPVIAELLYADRRIDRDMKKLRAVFRNFANAPKNRQRSGGKKIT